MAEVMEDRVLTALAANSTLAALDLAGSVPRPFGCAVCLSTVMVAGFHWHPATPGLSVSFLPSVRVPAPFSGANVTAGGVVRLLAVNTTLTSLVVGRKLLLATGASPRSPPCVFRST